jgi:hypothetical protein
MDSWQIKYAFPENVAMSAAAFRPDEFDQDRIDAAWQAVVSKWIPSAPTRAPDMSTAFGH